MTEKSLSLGCNVSSFFYILIAIIKIQKIVKTTIFIYYTNRKRRFGHLLVKFHIMLAYLKVNNLG